MRDRENELEVFDFLLIFQFYILVFDYVSFLCLEGKFYNFYNFL